MHAALHNGNGYVLLGVRARPDAMYGLSEVLGGKREDFDLSDRHALVREIFEETGLVVEVGRKIGEYYLGPEKLHHGENRAPRPVISALYEATIVKGEVRVDPDVHSRLNWVSAHMLHPLELEPSAHLYCPDQRPMLAAAGRVAWQRRNERDPHSLSAVNLRGTATRLPSPAGLSSVITDGGRHTGATGSQWTAVGAPPLGQTGRARSGPR